MRVSETVIRQRFNSENLYQRLQDGRIRQVIMKDKLCRLSTEPPGTRSQIVAYYDGRQKIALVHQYLRADGSIGASGLPDPKELLQGGILYYV